MLLINSALFTEYFCAQVPALGDCFKMELHGGNAPRTFREHRQMSDQITQPDLDCNMVYPAQSHLCDEALKLMVWLV